MEKVEAVRLALAELGDVSVAELLWHIRERHGIAVDPKFVPVFRAMFRDKEQRAASLRGQAISTAAATTSDDNSSPPMGEDRS
jgi:hypothetical protein